LSTQSLSTKYIIEARIEIDGIVDKNDVIGATFGQTEGIFSSDLDLRELQKTGRIGRIEVQVHSQGGKTVGKIIIPSSMDRFYTALIAAMVESLDKVGPYPAKVTIEKIEDVRAEKRKKIVERARAILYEWEKQKVPMETEVIKELEESVLRAKLVELGPDKLPAGPDAETADEVILTEGRADVINLMRYGYRNVIAMGGVKVPASLQKILSKKSKVIAFLDGDRGGDMILRELISQNFKVDLVARAPYGKEVEELTAREIEEALEAAVPLEEALRRARITVTPAVESKQLLAEALTKIEPLIREVEGNLMGIVLDRDLNELFRAPVSELAQKLSETSQFKYVVFDGVITQRLIDIASTKEEDVFLIGARLGENLSLKPNIHVLTMDKLRTQQTPESS
jgi:DNA primase